MKYCAIFKNDGYKIHVVKWKNIYICKYINKINTYHKSENIQNYDNYFVTVVGLCVILNFFIF